MATGNNAIHSLPEMTSSSPMKLTDSSDINDLPETSLLSTAEVSQWALGPDRLDDSEHSQSNSTENEVSYHSLL